MSCFAVNRQRLQNRHDSLIRTGRMGWKHNPAVVVQQVLHHRRPRPIRLRVKLSLVDRLGIRQAVRDLHTLTQ